MKLAGVVAAYVAYKQSLGMRFATEARTLKSFCRAIGDVDINQVVPDRVSAYLAGTGPVTLFWERKLSALNGFYRFAITRGYVASAPLPQRAARAAQHFIPYISRRQCSLSATAS